MNTIFIVGSSSGIGKATARLFAEKGWTVIATMRTSEKETELTSYPNVHLFPLDVTKPEQIETTVSAVLKEHDVDVLFNNAGYGMKTRFEDMTEESMQRINGLLLVCVKCSIMSFIHLVFRLKPLFQVWLRQDLRWKCPKCPDMMI